jgi:hypothetical protein
MFDRRGNAGRIIVAAFSTSKGDGFRSPAAAGCYLGIGSLGKSGNSLQVMAWLNAVACRASLRACQNTCDFSAEGRRK